jgi:hypothetical protein
LSLDTATNTEIGNVEVELTIEDIVKTPEDLFVEMVNSSSQVQDFAYAVMYLDENYVGSDKLRIVSDNFGELMHHRRFSQAVTYFGVLTKEERDHIITTRKYNYTLNDMEFKREYALDLKNPERKEFKRRGNL